MNAQILKRLPPRWQKWLPRLVIAFAVYSLIGFFVLPPILQWQMTRQLPALTKRKVQVRQVKLNPWTLSLTIRGLNLNELDGRPFASWEELYINFQASSLFRWAWTFKEIRLVKPSGEIVLLPDGRLNFANMFEAPTNAPPPKPAAPSSIPRVNVFHLQITNGYFAFEDHTRRSRFRTEYRPINLDVTQFSTRPDTDTPYSFRAESDAGRSISWAGDVTVQPLRSAGHLEVTGIMLRRYQPYLEDVTRAVVTNGTADIKLDYRFEAGTNGLELVATNGALHAENLLVQDPDTRETIAGLSGFDIQQASADYRARSARLGTVTISEALLLARLQTNGHLNWLDLLALPSTPKSRASTNSPPATAAPPWAASIDDLQIAQATVTFEDLQRRTQFKTELKPIEFGLKHFSTKADHDADYEFRVRSEAAEQIVGIGQISINPLRSAGTVKLTGFELKKYFPYYEDFFRGKIAAGQLTLQAPYRCALNTNGLQAGVSNLTASISNLEIQSPDAAESLVKLAEFELDQVSASWEEKTASVGRLQTRGGAILARRARDGSLNLAQLLPPAPAKTNSTPITPPIQTRAESWKARVEEIQLQDYDLKLEDQQPSKPATFHLSQLALNLKGAGTELDKPVNADVSLRFNDSAQILVRGQATVAPLSANLALDVDQLDLRTFQPYLEPYVALDLVSGALRSHGQCQIQASPGSSPQVAFTGSVGITNFVVADQVMFKEFARWEDLEVNGIDFHLQPNRLQVQQVKWLAPRANVHIGPDHKPNLFLILKAHPESEQSAAAAYRTSEAAGQASAAAGASPMQLAVLTLERAGFGFTDESIQPRASVGLQALSGTIKGLSSAMDTRAEVQLAGRVDEQSPIAISGQINPLSTNLFVDLVVSNANTQLTPLTPYLEKYAGHPLMKGRLSSSLHYRVENKVLKAENKIEIDHLTLGPRNNSPEATKLPVKLGIALLKDSNGRINLDLPVTGRLDDPQFSVGPIIVKVLLNTLAKAAASPFKLLGALVGGGEELSFIAFVPGTTNLVEGELAKLTKLAKALAQRPALSVEIDGAIDPLTDRQAIAAQKLREQLKTQRLQELRAKGRAPASAEAFVVEPEEFDRLLRTRFAEAFGTNIAAILQTNRLALSGTNAAVSSNRSPGKNTSLPLYRRFLAYFGFGNAGHRSAAEKHLTKSDRIALNEATPEVMQRLLASQVPVTDEDYHTLMVARSRWVQNWLLQEGAVAADRLLLITPKQVDAAYPGDSRANLSLD